jgi:hypothetical protein
MDELKAPTSSIIHHQMWKKSQSNQSPRACLVVAQRWRVKAAEFRPSLATSEELRRLILPLQKNCGDTNSRNSAQQRCGAFKRKTCRSAWPMLFPFPLAQLQVDITVQ